MSEASQPEDYLPSYETEAARRAWRRRTSLEMIISGSIGLFTSFVLSIEAWQLAADSSARFGCDISSVLSCSTVAQTWQARILGFPNAFLGIFFEAVVLAISVGIFAGVKFPRWYMLGTNLLYTIALFFAFWLFGQSYFIIQVLCPWCLLITLTTTLVFGGITRINIPNRACLTVSTHRGLVPRISLVCSLMSICRTSIGRSTTSFRTS